MKNILYVAWIILLVTTSFFSIAQINWTKYESNPVLVPGAPGSFNYGGYAFISVMKYNDTLQMWCTVSDQDEQRIGLAQSVNGYDIEFKEAVPLFEGSDIPGTFDSEGVFAPQILKINDTLWYMWYGGLDYTNFNAETGLATSADGLTWVRYSGEPVLERGSVSAFDAIVAYAGTVMIDDGMYKMWYTGMSASFSYKIGYATSADGIIWTKYSGNPIINFSAANPKVHKTETGYEMWYNEPINNRMYIYYALSDDGITWVHMDAPTVVPGPEGSFDYAGVTAPAVLLDNETELYQMWYTAWSDITHSYSVGYAFDSTLVNTFHSEKDQNVTLEVYPNPITSESRITYTIKTDTRVIIELYNLQGGRLSLLENTKRPPGRYTIPLNDLPHIAGSYLIRMVDESGSRMQKVLCIR